MSKYTKSERQKKLNEIIDKNPFYTDKELAAKFEVSVQTIRLDRMELNIPEVRKRTRKLAQDAYDNLRSVTEGEVIGELIKLELNNYAESFLKTTSEMALQETDIIRGHHIFAQANSLAVAVIDAELVLTGSVDMKFLKPVNIGDSIQAQAEVKDIQNRKYVIQVITFRKQEKIFQGAFTMFTHMTGEKK